jgi:hypothetical protein
MRRVERFWQTLADDLTKAGWGCGSISSTNHEGRQYWLVAAEREDAGRLIIHAHDMPTAFLELHAAIHCQFELDEVHGNNRRRSQ